MCLLPRDDAQPVRESARRIVRRVAPGDLVRAEEAEPDDELKPEMAPATWEIAPAGIDDGIGHRGNSTLTTCRRPRGPTSTSDIGHLDLRQIHRVGGPKLRVAVGPAAPDRRDRRVEIGVAPAALHERAEGGPAHRGGGR